MKWTLQIYCQRSIAHSIIVCVMVILIGRVGQPVQIVVLESISLLLPSRHAPFQPRDVSIFLWRVPPQTRIGVIVMNFLAEQIHVVISVRGVIRAWRSVISDPVAGNGIGVIEQAL